MTLPGFAPAPGEVHWAFAGGDAWSFAAPAEGLCGQFSGEASGDARQLAERLAEAALGASVRLGHLCPRCGSADHGRPFLLDAAGRAVPGLFVSLSRAGGVQVAAVASEPLGIDLEAESEPDPALGPVMLHEHEPRWSGPDLLRAWVAKEAVTKLLGQGLALDPRGIRLNEDATHAWVERPDAARGSLAGAAYVRVHPARVTVDGRRFVAARASYAA